MKLGNAPHFGKQYKFYQQQDAEAKKEKLAQQGIDSAIQYRSSDGMLQVLNWIVHTDENGTTDLTDFRNKK